MKHSIHISEDEAIVLGAYFDRFDQTDSLAFVHPAEYIALQRIAAQVDRMSGAPFDAEYPELLERARSRLEADFDGEVPGLAVDT